MSIDADEISQDAVAALASGTEDRLAAMRHSAAHMMAAAVMELFPDAKLGIGPAIKDGFYYDFGLSRPLTPADLEQIESKMQEQRSADHRFERSEASRADAVTRLESQGQPFKVEIVNDLPASDGETVSFYDYSDGETADSYTMAMRIHLQLKGVQHPIPVRITVNVEGQDTVVYEGTSTLTEFTHLMMK